MLISVIIPVYNTEQYLPRCIDSILNQSFTDFEILLIDDGSTDESGRICDSYAVKDERILVFHKENGGVSSARNIGLKNAKGEWVCFLDSDDEMLSGGVQVIANGISEDVDMVMAGYMAYDTDENLIYSVNSRIERIISNELAVKEMFEPSDYGYQGYICGKALRSSVLKRAKLHFAEDIFFNEDHLFITEFVCSSGRNVYYTTEPVYKYYERPNSVMMSLKKSFNPNFITDMEAQIRIREAVKEHFDHAQLLDMADEGVFHSYRRIKWLMKRFSYKDRQLSKGLWRRMGETIGWKNVIRFEIRRDKRRVLKKLKNLF